MNNAKRNFYISTTGLDIPTTMESLFHKNANVNFHFNRILFIHASCWTLFICYELFLTYYSSGRLEPLYIYLFYYTINIVFFYLHVSVLNFTFREKETNYIKGILFFLLLFGGNLTIKFFSKYIFESAQPTLLDQVKHFKAFLITNLFRTGYFATLATFYWAADHIAFYRKQSLEAEKNQLQILHEKSEIEIRLSETRNAYLQQQINPHMLFNSLNFIYNSVHKYSPEASHSVLLLSDIMRFSLEATGTDGKTTLKSEIEQIHNLIEINRQRYDEPLYLDVQIQGDMGKHDIIPLILFTLTENLFKHGNLKVKLHPAILRITVTEQGELNYFTRNLKRAKSDYKRNSSIGIQNIRTRMNFAYPEKYLLNLFDTDDFFETTLNVSL
ncbi:MAG: yehU 6 [Mucilaginibacter sp.]|nr:yehU 6 [Mucilaginibacter sp.]